MTLRRGLPPIPQETDPKLAVGVCLKAGACHMPAVVDAWQLFNRIGKHSPNVLFDNNRNLAEQLVTDRDAPDAFRALKAALQSFGLGEFNRAKMSVFEKGQVSPPHIDDEIPIDGVTALVPLAHGAGLRIYNNNWLGDVASDRLPTSEYESLYVTGDILLIRQAIPELELTPKIHSAETVFLDSDKNPLRFLLSLDHALN